MSCCLSVWLCACTSLCLSVCPSVSLSVCLSVCLTSRVHGHGSCQTLQSDSCQRDFRELTKSQGNVQCGTVDILGTWRQAVNKLVTALLRTGSTQPKGVGMEGATRALAPAMLKPRGERISFCPRNIFPDFFCMLFLKLPVVIYLVFYCEMHDIIVIMLPTIETSHSIGTTGRILQNKLTKHTYPARITRNE